VVVVLCRSHIHALNTCSSIERAAYSGETTGWYSGSALFERKLFLTGIFRVLFRFLKQMAGYTVRLYYDCLLKSPIQ